MTRLREASDECMAGRPILRRTCAQPVKIRVIPENEIPPAMRVDVYLKDYSFYPYCPIELKESCSKNFFKSLPQLSEKLILRCKNKGLSPSIKSVRVYFLKLL